MKVIGALGAILDHDVPHVQETEWLETKIPRDRDGRVVDSQNHKLRLIWILLMVLLYSKPFTQMRIKSSENSSLYSAIPEIFATRVSDPPLVRKKA